MLFSATYHVCDQHSSSYCIAKYEVRILQLLEYFVIIEIYKIYIIILNFQVLQYCDFFSGILAFWVTFVAMANLPVQYVSLFHMTGVIIITFGVESDKNGLASTLMPIIIGLAIPVKNF